MVYIYPSSKGRWKIYAVDTYYGTYDSLEEAIRRRDELIREGVIEPVSHRRTRYVYRTNSGNWIILKQIDGKMECFGTFRDKEKAIAERDYMEARNWRYDEGI